LENNRHYKLNKTFRPHKTSKKTRITLYITLDLPTLLYGSETWNIKARNAKRITAAEMKYIKKNSRILFHRL